MESQPQIPEFRNNPENFHPCSRDKFEKTVYRFTALQMRVHRPQDKSVFLKIIQRFR